MCHLYESIPLAIPAASAQCLVLAIKLLQDESDSLDRKGFLTRELMKRSVEKYVLVGV